MSNLQALIREELIFLDVEVKSSHDILSRLSNKALRFGFVKDSFEQALLDREREFPTGIQTLGGGVAIPHAYQGHVEKEFISITTLRNPVSFKSMENPNDTVDADVIFLLGLIDGANQLAALQQLVTLFQHPDSLSTLKTIKNKKQVFDTIQL